MGVRGGEEAAAPWKLVTHVGVFEILSQGATRHLFAVWRLLKVLTIAFTYILYTGTEAQYSNGKKCHFSNLSIEPELWGRFLDSQQFVEGIFDAIDEAQNF